MRKDEKLEEWLGMDAVHTSGGDESVILWARDNGPNDVEVLGISINSQVNLENYDPSPLARAAKYLAHSADIPFVWIGLENFDDGAVELGGGSYNITTLGLQQTAERLQHIFGTEYSSQGAGKKIEDFYNSKFHRWSSKVMPSEYVKTDIDAIVTDSPDNPNYIALIEARGSTDSDWNIAKYKEDAPQHIAYYKLLDNAALHDFDYCVVKYDKGVETIDKSDKVMCTIVDGINYGKTKWISYRAFKLSPEEAALKMMKTCQPRIS